MRHIKLSKTITIFAVLSIGNGFIASCSSENDAQEEAQNIYTIGTGSQSGLYWPYGGALARIWNQEIDEFTINVEVTAASVENTIKVINSDMLVGVSQANVVLNAYEGKGNFDEEMPVRVLFSLYPNLVHLVTMKDSDINTINDLKDKRVSLGAPGSGTYVTSSNLLSTLGFDIENDIVAQSLNYTETLEGIKNDQIDAGFLVGGSGLGAISQFALTDDIRIINITDDEIERFITANPAYSSFKVESNVYNSVPEFNTISIWNVLVVREDLDEDLAYEMVKTAYENIDEIVSTVDVARSTTIENVDKFNRVPLHKSTVKYIEEVTN